MLNRKLTSSILVVFLWLSQDQGGWSQSRDIAGRFDQGVIFPVVEGSAGEKDSAAIELISAYLATIRCIPWIGLSGEGTLALELGADQQKFPASLELDQFGRSRLDVTFPSGRRSIRTSGAVSGIEQENGTITHMPPDARLAGLFVTPYALSTALKDPLASLIYDGLVSLEGTEFYKITYIRPLQSLASAKASLSHPLISTLMFDPKSHLLTKSVDIIRLTSGSGVRHLRVMTFSDYRSVGASLLPHVYQETLDGRLEWELILATASAGSSQERAYFEFGGGLR